MTDVVRSSKSAVGRRREPELPPSIACGVPVANEGKRLGTGRSAVTGSDEARGISRG